MNISRSSDEMDSHLFGLVASSFFEEEDLYLSHLIKQYKNIIAVDGGLRLCLKLGIIPKYFVGDFDSCDDKTLSAFSDLEIIKLERDKDKTDLEVAVQLAFEKFASHLHIFCALGGRTDHLIGNINLLTRFPGKISLDSSKENIFIIHKHCILSLTIGQTLSLIPMNGPVLGITTKGLKWELKNQSLDKHFIGISNVALEKTVEISVSSGDLLCVIQKFSC